MAWISARRRTGWLQLHRWLGLVLLVWGNVALDRLLITKVRSDLAVAHGYFDRVQGEVAASTGAVADSQALHAALAGPGAPDAAQLRQLLRRFQQREALDFINLRSADGHLLLADFDGAALAEGVAAPLPVELADTGRRTMATVAVLSPAQQGLLAPALRARVRVPLVATRNAQPTQRSHEDRAMVLQASAPVRDAAGRLLAWVQATPNSIYGRKLGHLWERLHQQRLPGLADPGVASAYAPLFDPAQYFVGPAQRDARWRIEFNGLGDMHFCPVVRKTPALLAN